MLHHLTRCVPTIVDGLVLTFNFEDTLEELVAAGNFAYVDGGFVRYSYSGREHQGTVSHELATFNFGYYISTKEAMHEIYRHDSSNVWHPAKVEHLIAFGAKKPQEQLAYPINALGSTTMSRGRRNVPCLYHVNLKRALILDIPRWDRGWEPDYRFLAYRSARKGLFSWVR